MITDKIIATLSNLFGLMLIIDSTKIGNRSQNSHQIIREKERQMRKFHRTQRT